MVSSFKDLERFLNADLKVFVRFMKKRYKRADLRESDTKGKKLQKLCKVLRISVPEVKLQRKVRKHSVKSLHELSKNVLSSQKVSKHALNVAYSECIWPSKLQWKSKSTVDDRVNSSLGDDFYWFSIPEFSEKRKQLEVKSVDPTHLFTRIR